MNHLKRSAPRLVGFELFQHILIDTLSQFPFMQAIAIVSNSVFAISIVATLYSWGIFWALENLPILPLGMPKRDPYPSSPSFRSFSTLQLH
jgi:hypothetical protein